MRMTKSGTPASFPDPKQLDTLPFLDAVVTETLRLHAPLPGAQPRQTPDSGCRIGQYALPGGVRVAAMPYMLHRNETIFPEPEKWDPERWLAPVRGPDDEEQRRQMNRHFWAFSSGGRMCIGSNFALHEIKLTITAIYTNFKSYIVDDTGMENQTDGYGGRPEKEQLILRFEKLVD
ncbi:cytochrome P450 monooxygenase-like protein [Thermochaetoides thermophila DSM 1495]|uniref:Cytochrome P450 monooxygenase-like protein n=1 Tax=Chaetomium thermophilum (strain DSM 1495 / CBS 144.50 / IMI 039719) TaxID=759272 RepID=G0SAI8_CHATD|nr:cytochrome P450 monooxygenase-like protein [Thermochaetoides thermophila DSM 1495]EGS19760.1 cytochrome P450 monooxygenase-like protein [Thermochaetoides thermophila DSM 1495]